MAHKACWHTGMLPNKARWHAGRLARKARCSTLHVGTQTTLVRMARLAR